MSAKFYAYRRTWLAVPSVLGRLRIIPLAFAWTSRAGVGLQSLDTSTKVFYRDFSIDSPSRIWIHGFERIEIETKRNVRTRERRTAGEQVDVAIFGDHVLRIEPQWLWEVDSTLFFTLSLSLPLPLVHTAWYRCSILFLHGYQEFCKATKKKQSYLYFFFCCDLSTLCTFACSLSFLYLFSCTRDLFVSFVYVFFFFLFWIFFFTATMSLRRIGFKG